VVLDPAGEVAAQQRDLLVQSTLLMLLIIVPVMALIVLFAWRYRVSNKTARYEPEWEHSTQLELVIWGAPLLIIICLGALTWMGTHLLDPYRALARQPGKNVEPLQVEVVALDWKWLFIYPQYGVATVNEVAAPVGRPISFHITSASVMNSFFIPALAGQIYAMSGMETRLHAVIDKPGAYEGFSANYSGAGFSGMRFVFTGMPAGAFAKWVDRIKASGGSLDRANYMALEQPSENVPVSTYAAVDATLFDAILNLCVEPGKMCVNEMMAIDAKGGLGLAGVYNVLPLTYDKYGRPDTGSGGVARLCTPQTKQPAWNDPHAIPMTPVRGAGLPHPRTLWQRWTADSARSSHS
jgi:cytochrome o ubiquinol oxidase subunit II